MARAAGFTYASAVVTPRPAELRNNSGSTSAPKDGFPTEAVEPNPFGRTTHNKKRYHRCMYEPLQRNNYKKKFSELVKCEQATHQNILSHKCSCDCTLTIEADPACSSEEDSELNAFLDGLSDDQIAYVAQSAEHKEGVIIMAKNRKFEVCKASILRTNYSHTDTKLYIAFDEVNKTKLQARFRKAKERTCVLQVHVKFDLKNSYFRNLSQCIWSIPPAIVNKIMPDNHSLCRFEHQDLRPYLPKGTYSADQLQALDMIVSSSRNGPPSLITGPFGTGKSHLLGTAAFWLFQRSLDISIPSRILVCTQQRESADNFFLLYQGLMPKEKDATVFIIREYGRINMKLRRWTKSVEQFKKHVMDPVRVSPESTDVENYLIIMPCLTALRVHKNKFLPPDFFSHIFIDEGAQMREPETLGPLSMASDSTKVVIAGDPWQVGPSMLVLGEEAQQNGLSISLLQRLHDIYQADSAPPSFKKMISSLDHCHRCHRDILGLSTELFYGMSLKIPKNEELRNPSEFPYPLYFVCSSVEVDCTSKSTKNAKEAEILLNRAEYIAANWSKRLWGGQYHLDMCVMSPTRSQLTVVLDLLKSGQYASKLMEVRRVPTFFMQGKEYKVLLLSTSEPVSAKGASANPTKSLCNPFVFNTAITRAQSLVVSVGNPFLLLKMEQAVVKEPGYETIGRCWSNYFKRCIENGTFQIPDSLGLSAEQQEAVLMNIKEQIEKRLKVNVHYPPQIGTEDETESQTTVFTENLDVQPSSSHFLSTTDVESTSHEPTSTETQQSVDILSKEEVKHPPEIQVTVSTASEAGQSLNQMLQKQPLQSTPISDFEKDYAVLGSPLGGGGFGVVFRVKYSLDETEYALKVIPLPNEPSKQERVLREVKALARLIHPHIVRYSHSWKERAPDNWHYKKGWKDMRSRFISFLKRKSASSSASPAPIITSGVRSSDSVVTFRNSTSTKTSAASIPDASLISGTRSPQPISATQGSSKSGSTLSSQALISMLCESPPTCLFIRMELCKDDTLKDWLSKNNKENSRLKKDVLNYFEQMLRALEYIHQRDYIHRDLKPSNIFFSREDNQLKIGDFGLVTTGITDDSTAFYSDKRSRYQAGTPIYASPEQLSGHGVCSTKSDIYTLGLICFELHYICRTSAEKTKVFDDLRRKGKFPPEFQKRIYKEVSNIIVRMIEDQSTRPSAGDILEGKDFKELTSKVNKRKKAVKQPYIPFY